MGERLVVEIKRNSNTVAAAYYHWSAYTMPAIEILSSMNTHVLSKANTMTDDELQLALIKFAECTTAFGYIADEEAKLEVIREFEEKFSESPDSVQDMLSDIFLKNGGVNPDDKEYAETKFHGEIFREDVSRNEGLICITESTIQRAISWAEWVTTIDLDDNKVLGNVVYEYDIESYLEETEDWDEEEFVDPDDIPRSPINLCDFGLDEIKIVKDVLEITQSGWIRYKDAIYQLKEG